MNQDVKYAVYHADVGTVAFESMRIALELYNKLTGPRSLFRIDADGTMTKINETLS